MCCVFSRDSACFCLQDSAKKLEQNISLFGSTVESLLYRYGKVLYFTSWGKEKKCFGIFLLKCFLFLWKKKSHLCLNIWKKALFCNVIRDLFISPQSVFLRCSCVGQLLLSLHSSALWACVWLCFSNHVFSQTSWKQVSFPNPTSCISSLWFWSNSILSGLSSLSSFHERKNMILTFTVHSAETIHKLALYV